MKNFIKNTWHFRGFLQNNESWSYIYLFCMLREKLKTDIKQHKQRNIILSQHNNLKKCALLDDIISQMEFCIKILNRIICDEYVKNAFFPFDKKYPNWAKDKKYDKKLFRDCFSKAKKQKQQDIDLFFEYLSKHIQNWWI